MELGSQNEIALAQELQKRLILVKELPKGEELELEPQGIPSWDTELPRKEVLELDLQKRLILVKESSKGEELDLDIE